MERAIEKQPVGSLKISEDVVATIASVAALEIEGVDSLPHAASRFGGLFKRSSRRGAVHIEIKDDFIEVEVALNLKYGARIDEVCTRVQSNVKDNIQTMTGMAVSKVNVLVDGIVFPEEGDGKAPSKSGRQ